MLHRLADATIGVVGAGTMGAGIAQVAAQAGHAVVIYDIEEAFVNRGLERIEAFVARAAEKGKMTDVEAAAIVARVATSTNLTSLAPCAVVIEAAPEDLNLKSKLFAQLEDIVQDEAILASNTSTLSIAALGGAVKLPGRLCGLHFFNPAPLMPLVEVITGPETDSATVDDIEAMAEAWGKETVRAEDRPGFIVNRVARPFYGEALRTLGEGIADVATIDGLARDAGFPMGPFQLMDLIGIDVNLSAAQSVYDGFFQDPRFRPHPIQRAMVESGRLGRKAGRGYYEYDDAS